MLWLKSILLIRGVLSREGFWPQPYSLAQSFLLRTIEFVVQSCHCLNLLYGEQRLSSQVVERKQIEDSEFNERYRCDCCGSDVIPSSNTSQRDSSAFNDLVRTHQTSSSTSTKPYRTVTITRMSHLSRKTKWVGWNTAYITTQISVVASLSTEEQLEGDTRIFDSLFFPSTL
jgi:hypothetical protein